MAAVGGDSGDGGSRCGNLVATLGSQCHFRGLERENTYFLVPSSPG